MVAAAAAAREQARTTAAGVAAAAAEATAEAPTGAEPGAAGQSHDIATTVPQSTAQNELDVLFVKNLAFHASKADVESAFGALQTQPTPRVHLVTNKRGRSRGCAYVYFHNESALNRAVAAGTAQICGRDALCERKRVAVDFFETEAARRAQRPKGSGSDTNDHHPASVHPLTVYVTGIPLTATAELGARSAFSSFGTVACLRMLKQEGTALVQFASTDAVQAALSSPVNIDGVTVHCAPSKFPAVVATQRKRASVPEASSRALMKPRSVARTSDSRRVVAAPRSGRAGSASAPTKRTANKANKGGGKQAKRGRGNDYFAKLMGR